jgi:hypothetical protein
MPNPEIIEFGCSPVIKIFFVEESDFYDQAQHTERKEKG